MFIVLDKSQSIIAFIINDTIGYIKNKGNQINFNTGFTKIFKKPKIIHQSKYVFQAYIHSGETITAPWFVSLFSKNHIKNNIEAFNIIEKKNFIKN